MFGWLTDISRVTLFPDDVAEPLPTSRFEYCRHHGNQGIDID
jgi:hypothetical protein